MRQREKLIGKACALILLAVLWGVAACRVVDLIAVKAAVTAAESVGALFHHAMQPRPAIVPADTIMGMANLLLVFDLPLIVVAVVVLTWIIRRGRHPVAGRAAPATVIAAGSTRGHGLAA